MPDSPTDSGPGPPRSRPAGGDAGGQLSALEQIAVNTDRHLDQILVEMREMRADLRTL